MPGLVQTTEEKQLCVFFPDCPWQGPARLSLSRETATFRVASDGGCARHVQVLPCHASPVFCAQPR